MASGSFRCAVWPMTAELSTRSLDEFIIESRFVLARIARLLIRRRRCSVNGRIVIPSRASAMRPIVARMQILGAHGSVQRLLRGW